jgi:hypothetical protein
VTTIKIDLFDVLHLHSKDDGQKFVLKAIPMPLRASEFKRDEHWWTANPTFPMMFLQTFALGLALATVHTLERTNWVEQESASVQTAAFF